MRKTIVTVIIVFITYASKAQNDSNDYKLLLDFETQLENHILGELDNTDSAGAIFYAGNSYPILKRYFSTTGMETWFNYISRDTLITYFDSSTTNSIFRTETNYNTFFNFITTKNNQRVYFDNKNIRGTWAFVHNPLETFEIFFLDRLVTDKNLSICIVVDFFYFKKERVHQLRKSLIFDFSDNKFRYKNSYVLKDSLW